MVAKINPGDLGTFPYPASGTVDTTAYTPRNGAKTVTIASLSITAGTSQVFLQFGDIAVALGAAVAQTAGELNSFKIDMALHKMGTVFIRFVDTSATAGAVIARATDDA